MAIDESVERARLASALAAAARRQEDLEHRLVALVATSGTLFGSPEIEDVLPGVIVLAQTLVPADGYAVWRFDVASGAWRIGESSGISSDFVHRIASTYDGDPASAVPFSEPLVAEAVQQVPLLGERTDAYGAEGIQSLLAVPLTIAGRAGGTLVFYYRDAHAFTDIEVQTARALGNLAGAAITTAELFDEQRRSREEAERANRRSALLVEASVALASSLDYAATLRTVASLAVPQFADWCTVDIVDDRGEIQRVGVAHVDPSKVDEIRNRQKQYSADRESPGTVSQVIRTGVPIMIPEVTDEMLVARARDEEHLRTLRSLDVRSVIVVPLLTDGQASGALSFVTTKASGRRYGEADFQLAQDLANRSALAVENARAYRQLNAANRAKDEFMATLSHELRTPLNAVLGWARMLCDGTIGPGKTRRAYEVIERNATAQLDLVEDLLDLSRIITGKFRLNVGVVDLSAAIDSAVDAIQPAAAAKGINVRIDAEADAGVVLGDEGRLQQAVWNLLSNAIKFTPTGGDVTVSRRRRGGDLEVEVRDTGEGIDPAVLPYVFDRFRQADSGTTRTHMGLGLGLAIVRHIVELHGGEIGVSSDGKGKGAVFRLRLPVLPAEQPAMPLISRRVFASPPRLGSLTLSGIRAIIVDDDRDARELVTEVLRSRGASVTAVGSAEECLTALDQHVPDVILSDIAMPQEDGYRLIQRIRERQPDRGGRVPAVALTAYARAEDSDRSLAAGFQVHLSKPVDLDQLLETVARLSEPRARS